MKPFTVSQLNDDFHRYVDKDNGPTLILMTPEVYNQLWARMDPASRQGQPVSFSAEGLHVTVQKREPMYFNGVKIIQVPSIPNDKGYLILPDISVLAEMDVCKWRMGIE